MQERIKELILNLAKINVNNLFPTINWNDKNVWIAIVHPRLCSYCYSTQLLIRLCYNQQETTWKHKKNLCVFVYKLTSKARSKEASSKKSIKNRKGASGEMFMRFLINNFWFYYAIRLTRSRASRVLSCQPIDEIFPHSSDEMCISVA